MDPSLELSSLWLLFWAAAQTNEAICGHKGVLCAPGHPPSMARSLWQKNLASMRFNCGSGGVEGVKSIY